MENKVTRKLYDMSPATLRSVYASAYGLYKNKKRYGEDYEFWYKNFKSSEFMERDRITDFQWEKMSRHLHNAYRNVPYYNALFRRVGIKPEDIGDASSLARIPLLEKEFVRKSGRSLLVEKAASRGLEFKRTSGSTGSPMAVPWYPGIEHAEWGFLWARARPGVTRGDKYSSFSGRDIVPAERTVPPYWVVNWASRQKLYSIFHMSPKNLELYYWELNRGYNDYFSGYSSAVSSLASYMLENGLRFEKPPKAFFHGSEELQASHKAIIEEAFECKLWNHYGQVELVASITEYDCGNLHYDMDYSFVEFLPQEVLENGEVVAEIVASNFNNEVWPLIRYRTGDLVVYHPEDSCACGRPGQVIRRIHGRTGRYIELDNGRRITNISIVVQHCRNIRGIQVVQKRIGEIIIRVVKDKLFTQGDEKNIIDSFRKRLGPGARISIEYLETIPKDRSGKTMTIVNEMSKEDKNGLE